MPLIVQPPSSFSAHESRSLKIAGDQTPNTLNACVTS
jgi:hypothetical protein